MTPQGLRPDLAAAGRRNYDPPTDSAKDWSRRYSTVYERKATRMSSGMASLTTWNQYAETKLEINPDLPYRALFLGLVVHDMDKSFTLSAEVNFWNEGQKVATLPFDYMSSRLANYEGTWPFQVNSFLDIKTGVADNLENYPVPVSSDSWLFNVCAQDSATLYTLYRVVAQPTKIILQADRISFDVKQITITGGAPQASQSTVLCMACRSTSYPT